MSGSGHVTLRHLALPTTEPDASARFLSEVLGLAIVSSDSAAAVLTHDGVAVRFDRQVDAGCLRSSLSFVVDEDDFETVYGRLLDRRVPYWADPERQRQSEIHHLHRGRGLYVLDPSGHLVEITTSRVVDQSQSTALDEAD